MQGDGSLDKILLVDRRTSYVLSRSTGLDPSLGSKPNNFEYFGGEEVDIDDNHAEIEQPEDISKH